MNWTSKLFCTLACLATMGAANTGAQTPLSATFNNNGLGAAPNGIAALQLTPANGELLFTQAFCDYKQARGVYSENVTAGTSTMPYSVYSNGQCAENYIAISPGLGGFTAGDTFVTGPSSTPSSTASAVYRNGSSTPFIDGIATSAYHVGIAFDTSGTFGYSLIVTAQGTITGYDAAGHLKFTYTPASPDFVLEGATVAPLTYGPCPGCLFITAAFSADIDSLDPTGSGAILYVKPGFTSGLAAVWSQTPNAAEPEGLVFVGNNLSCTLHQGSNATPYTYFVSGYATSYGDNSSTSGKILAYTPQDLQLYVNDMLIPDERGIIYAFAQPATPTTPPSVFSNTGFQLEGSTILSCAASATGCPATMGYWKHHTFPSSMFFPGTVATGTTSIGCMNYTSQQLKDILNTAPQGGNAVLVLAHQLIAAIANYDAGGTQTAAASQAIASSLDLLCANGINLLTSNVSANSPLGQQMTALANTLDTYNSSAPNCEGSGLS